MVTFQVNDMTCGHCASAIARAVASVDPNARLDVRIQEKLVHVDSAEASAAELAQAIQEAGYTPQEARQEPAPPVAALASGKRGCGCGCGTPKTPAVDNRQQVAPAGDPCSS